MSDRSKKQQSIV